MGQAFELDKARVNRTGEQLLRAFYFTEMGTPIPRDAGVQSWVQHGPQTDRPRHNDNSANDEDVP